MLIVLTVVALLPTFANEKSSTIGTDSPVGTVTEPSPWMLTWRSTSSVEVSSSMVSSIAISLPSSSVSWMLEHSSNTSETALSASSISPRSEEHTSELQSLMRSSYAFFCLKKKQYTQQTDHFQTISSIPTNCHAS